MFGFYHTPPRHQVVHLPVLVRGLGAGFLNFPVNLVVRGEDVASEFTGKVLDVLI